MNSFAQSRSPIAAARSQVLVIAVFGLLFGISGLKAQSTICAAVQLQISQQLTFERQGFTATIAITNGLPATSLTNVAVTLLFTNAQGGSVSSTPDPSAVGNAFFYEVAPGTSQPSTISGGTSANLQWLIIPSAGAGGTTPSGTEYFVGATLTYEIAGVTQSVTVTPDYIYVMPQPEFTLDYFLPSQVYGRDPTSSTITPPIPFNLGVRVKNIGYGTASNFQINSGQPQIINNPQNLAVQFVLVSASVNDAPAMPTLLANFGTVIGQQSAVARWVMTSSLSGEFSFTATFSHADSLGGAVTSLLTATVSHSLLRDVLVDLPGRDNVRDFLAQDGAALTVYESQGTDTSVSNISGSTTLSSKGNSVYQMSVPPNSGFTYAQVGDPFSGQMIITSALRGDGKQINLDNVWLSKQFIVATGNWSYSLNLFDDNNANGFPYSISFGKSPLPPIFSALSDQILSVGKLFTLTVKATDPDGTTPTLTTGVLPSGATFAPATNGTGLFSWTPSAAEVGTYPVTFLAAEGTLSSNDTINLTVTAGSKFQGWKDKYFPGITDPSIIGDNANPSGDGLSNLLKYALNLDPTKPSPNSGIQIGETLVNGQRYLTLTYVVRTDDPNLQYSVIESNSPSAPDSSWTPQTQLVSTVSQNGVPLNMQRFEVVDSVSINAGQARRFLKLHVVNTAGDTQ